MKEACSKERVYVNTTIEGLLDLLLYLPQMKLELLEIGVVDNYNAYSNETNTISTFINPHVGYIEGILKVHKKASAKISILINSENYEDAYKKFCEETSIHVFLKEELEEKFSPYYNNVYRSLVTYMIKTGNIFLKEISTLMSSDELIVKLDSLGIGTNKVIIVKGQQL